MFIKILTSSIESDFNKQMVAGGLRRDAAVEAVGAAPAAHAAAGAVGVVRSDGALAAPARAPAPPADRPAAAAAHLPRRARARTAAAIHHQRRSQRSVHPISSLFLSVKSSFLSVGFVLVVLIDM